MKFPKQTYVRSPALLKACRELHCMHCGTSDQTVCAAHSNQARHGKGRSIKASDEYVAALCFACHSELDQGAFLSQAGRVAMWDAAHFKTVQALKQRGQWINKEPA